MTVRSVRAAVAAWLALLFRSIVDLYPRGVALFWLAPAVLALVVVPEFLQHVAEIELGMFDNGESARKVADDPIRWAFGYAKIAGLILAFFAAARFWWLRGGEQRWWDLRTVAWGRFLAGLLLFCGLPLLGELIEPVAGTTAKDVATWLITFATLPFLLLMLAGLFGDRQTTLRQMWTRGWPALLMLCLLVPLAFAPAQILHGFNHRWAFGAEPVLVWVLMIFDSLVVGLLAALTGTALFLGYAAFARRKRKVPPA